MISILNTPLIGSHETNTNLPASTVQICDLPVFCEDEDEFERSVYVRSLPFCFHFIIQNFENQYYFSQEGTLNKKPKPKQKETTVLAESMVRVADTFSHYLADKNIQLENQPPPPANHLGLKHYHMWANYDKMIEKLDDNAIQDLNMELMILIGNIVKKNRQ